MGLLYVFPVSADEEGFVIKDETSLTLKTYGLPYIFWIYALCIISIIIFMFFAIKAPILKLISLGDSSDASLGYSLLAFISFMPLSILGFFFYEKRIIRIKNEIQMIHKIFGLTFFSESFILAQLEPFTINSFLSSPNVARMKSNEETLGFQNKGYFILWIKTIDGKKIQIDRHSRKVDLEKLQLLLESN
jgi:hypothetical protein